ncbi:MAG: hypothetical protein PWQ12_1535 [Clostridiales bacterium]|nr:hypothetical protein [Clostridiales bacterium]
MVPKAGVEPARVLPLRILSPARLPVPPLRLTAIIGYHKLLRLTREIFSFVDMTFYWQFFKFSK